jgi:glycosyltransferase involved in cell wall biosynthesis
MRVAILADFPIHIIPGFERFAPPGHYATWLPQLSESWARQTEVDLHWIVLSRRVHHPEPTRFHGQTFHCLHVPGKLRALRLYRADCRAIRRRLDELAPDLVHAWGNEDCYGLAGVLSGRKLLLSVQGLLTYYCAHAPMHPFVHLQAMYERFVLRRARHITGESPWAVGQIRQLAPQAEMSQVEYGVDPLFYARPWQPEAAQPIALFAGSIDPRKGIQDAVQAFADPRLAHAELWVLGQSGSRWARRLRASAPPNVRWLGRKSLSETADLMARAWCFVIPTRGDTGPTAVKEARVMGLPVISTPHGGQRDYIAEGQNGFLLAPGDITGLAAKLAVLLGDISTARRFGAHRHEEQRRYFRPENTAANFLDLYRQLIGQSAGALGPGVLWAPGVSSRQSPE